MPTATLAPPASRTATAVAPVAAGVTRGGPQPPAVVFDGVSFAFDEHVVLRDVSFVVPSGGMTILLGPSGAGKSVILKLILGLLRCSARWNWCRWTAARRPRPRRSKRRRRLFTASRPAPPR